MRGGHAGRKRDHRETGRLLPERVAAPAERIPVPARPIPRHQTVLQRRGDERAGVRSDARGGFLSWIEQLDPAVLFEGDDQLNALMASFEALVDPFDAPRSKLRFMEVLLHVKARGLPTGRRHSYYTKSHMRIARTTHDRLCADLGCDYRLRDIADSFGISVTSLNNYFQGVYGVPVPTYLRERRLQEAAKLLEVTDESVATIAARVGYANPSKFSAAFKRRYNATPREYRTKRR